MSHEMHMQIVKDLPNKKITITRQFNATPQIVWRAFTESALLDQWWAPRPWRAQTKTMNFKEGGYWLYAMVGPSGEKHWAKVDFITIDSLKGFTAMDNFCDEEGNTNNELPGMHWQVMFEPTGKGTQVVVVITFANEKDGEKIVEMGFESGFTSALTNLDALLQTERQWH